LLFEDEENNWNKKNIIEEMNRFYEGKNTSSFASKVGRFSSNLLEFRNLLKKTFLNKMILRKNLKKKI